MIQVNLQKKIRTNYIVSVINSIDIRPFFDLVPEIRLVRFACCRVIGLSCGTFKALSLFF